MNTESYYDILGLKETATQDEIKKTYRKLAKENHPDAGGDEDKFKKISEAYDILSDEGKRRDYDYKKQNPFSDRFGDMFGDIFNNRNRQHRAHTTTITINVGVIESYNGGKKTITYKRKTKCEPCNGTGGDKKVCSSCNGQGTFVKHVNNGFFVQMVQMECQTCRGTGNMLINPCFMCKGTGQKDEIKNVDIQLPHGLDNGQFLRLQGMGDFINNMFGDLIVKVNLTPHNGFDRVGNHLIYNAYMNLDELKDGSILVPHPDGQLNLKLPKKVDTSIPLRVRNKGFKLDTIGDLIVNQFVKYERD